MKYIRTTNYDGIWEVVEETELIYRVKARGEPHHIYSKSKCQTTVVNQADTIDKLCDCFVKIKRKGNCKPYILKFDHKDLSALRAQKIKFPESLVYGAILVEGKGLVFAAEMNKEGWFELC